LTRELGETIASSYVLIKNELELKKVDLTEDLAQLLFGVVLGFLSILFISVILLCIVVAAAFYVYQKFASFYIAIAAVFVLMFSLIGSLYCFRENWIHKPIRNYLFTIITKRKKNGR
jgi:uncharacterized membrane protein YqjE